MTKPTRRHRRAAWGALGALAVVALGGFWFAYTREPTPKPCVPARDPWLAATPRARAAFMRGIADAQHGCGWTEQAIIAWLGPPHARSYGSWRYEVGAGNDRGRLTIYFSADQRVESVWAQGLMSHGYTGNELTLDEVAGLWQLGDAAQRTLAIGVFASKDARHLDRADLTGIFGQPDAEYGEFLSYSVDERVVNDNYYYLNFTIEDDLVTCIYAGERS